MDKEKNSPQENDDFEGMPPDEIIGAEAEIRRFI